MNPWCTSSECDLQIAKLTWCRALPDNGTSTSSCPQQQLTWLCPGLEKGTLLVQQHLFAGLSHGKQAADHPGGRSRLVPAERVCFITTLKRLLKDAQLPVLAWRRHLCAPGSCCARCQAH